MDSFELNKILGAVLFTCLCSWGSILRLARSSAHPSQVSPGYEIAIPEKPEGGGAAPAAPQESLGRAVG